MENRRTDANRLSKILIGSRKYLQIGSDLRYLFLPIRSRFGGGHCENTQITRPSQLPLHTAHIIHNTQLHPRPTTPLYHHDHGRPTAAEAPNTIASHRLHISTTRGAFFRLHHCRGARSATAVRNREDNLFLLTAYSLQIETFFGQSTIRRSRS